MIDLGVAGFQVGDVVRSLREQRDLEGEWRVVDKRPTSMNGYRIFVASVLDDHVRFFDKSEAFELVRLAEPFEAHVTYFKASGKYYTSEKTPWPRDPTHHSGWVPFASLHRLRDMTAVCLETPVGYPQMSVSW